MKTLSSYKACWLVPSHQEEREIWMAVFSVWCGCSWQRSHCQEESPEKKGRSIWKLLTAINTGTTESNHIYILYWFVVTINSTPKLGRTPNEWCSSATWTDTHGKHVHGKMCNFGSIAPGKEGQIFISTHMFHSQHATPAESFHLEMNADHTLSHWRQKKKTKQMLRVFNVKRVTNNMFMGLQTAQLHLHETEGAMDLCHEVLQVLLPQDRVFRQGRWRVENLNSHIHVNCLPGNECGCLQFV